MAPERTLSRKTVQRLIFCGEENPSEDIETVEEFEEERQAAAPGEGKRLSAYVEVFEGMALVFARWLAEVSRKGLIILQRSSRLSSRTNTRCCQTQRQNFWSNSADCPVSYLGDLSCSYCN